MAQFPAMPAVSILGGGLSGTLNSSGSVVLGLPFTINGFKPARVRIMLSTGVAFVRLAGSASSATALTSDTMLGGYEALILNTLGNNAIAIKGVGATAQSVQVSALEDGALTPSTTPSGQ